MPQAGPFFERLQDQRLASRAGNAAGVASFLALSAVGRRSALGRVLPALAVRRHVRQAFEQFGVRDDRRSDRRKRLRMVAGAGAIAALAIGASRRRRPDTV
jgi:hypothetical protein